MINIQQLNNVSPEIEKFQKQEWKSADLEHFGRLIDWKKETQVLNATENEELIGVLEFTMQSGVMHIDSLIIKNEKRGQGVGKMLMDKAEEIAKNNDLHKIYLDTGKTWKAVEFYETLGYEKTGELPNHLENQDYVEYSKFLKTT